ncbi:MAG: hypothetical protein OEZ06_25710 [Myxococcales bacterium]|nr:hypothetical protein [Myxococcales bacterium]
MKTTTARRGLPPALLLLLLGLGLGAPAVHALGTEHFSLDSASVLSAGKLEGTAVRSTGAVVPSVESRRLGLPNVGVARSLLVRDDGSVLIGTGNDGKIFVLKGEQLGLLAETGELLVTALVEGPGGRVFAGTLPHGRIFEIDPKAPATPVVETSPSAEAKAKTKAKSKDKTKDKKAKKKADAKKADAKKADAKTSEADKPEAKEPAEGTEPKRNNAKLFAEPEGAEHIWALLYDASKKSLYAATGPEGKVFAIDEKGKAEVYYDSDASHIMALALGPKGRLYAGTSDEALVLELLGPGRAEVLYDFEGNEVTALAAAGGRLAVAANLFPKAPASKAKKDKSKDDSKDKTDAARARPKAGKGELWVIEPDGRTHRLFASDEGHLTSLEWTKDGALYAATGKGGHIHRVEPGGSHALWIDVDERQVLATALGARTPLFTTGDGGAIYRLVPGRAQQALWTSKVLDAGFRSRWGQLTWRGRGGLSFQTRSGHTDKPDDSWSAWSSPLAGPGPIRSPGARFLQVRARLDAGGDSELYAVQAYYRPTNQPATIKEVSVEPKGDANAKKRRARPKPSSVYEVAWKVDNPDKDQLRYRLFFRPEGKDFARPLLEEHETHTSEKYDWDTTGIPDGYYRLAVEASDELDNAEPLASSTRFESEPFLIDNHRPRVDGLRVAGKNVVGVARDSQGPIARLEYAIDGGEFKTLDCRDGIFDTRVENFSMRLPPLPAGAHVVAVRASDSRGNQSTEETWFTLK